MLNVASTSLRNFALAAGLGATVVALAAVLFSATAPAGYGPKLKPNLKSKKVIASRSFTITGSDNPQRFEVYCPRGLRPLGGGVITDRPPDGTGAGAYPVSYERLGKQDGWHIGVAQVGRGGSTSVTLQVLCRRYKGDIDPEEKFIKSRTYKNVAPGQTKRFTQTCPRGKQLISGGYLSSHFYSGKGVYVTESRMAGPRSWTISATGVPGGSGGQVSSIAYCISSRKPLLTEVASAPASVRPGDTATTATPECPGAKQLIVGGFSAPSTVRVFDAGFQGTNTWTASAAPYTGAGEITALGYCL